LNPIDCVSFSLAMTADDFQLLSIAVAAGVAEAAWCGCVGEWVWIDGWM
jgi:hypothetical protein